MVDTILHDETADLVYLPGVKAVGMTDRNKQPTRPVVKDPENEAILGKIQPWGEDNDFPQQLAELGSNSTIIGPTLEKKVNFLYGKGVKPFVVTDIDDAGNEKLRALKSGEIQEIDDFILRTNLQRYILEAANDFYWFLNPFPELILSKNRKKIKQIVAQEATYCRWGIMDEREGRSKYCYINANWPDTEEKYIKKVATIDPYAYDRFEQLRHGNEWKYIYPLSYPSPGKSYYQLVPWYAASMSGWLDVAQAIPKWKKALMANQISIKYIIKVPAYWWEWKYPDWNEKKNLQKKRKETEYKKVETFLTGEENAGKPFMTTFKYSHQMQKELPGWSIEAVDNKMKDGMYIEDSQEASAHLLYALGVDPTLVGFSPGGKNRSGGGSGSDKRVAYNMYIETIEPHRDIILEPLRFISQYNGWPSELRWKFTYSQIATLQGGQETTQNVQ